MMKKPHSVFLSAGVVSQQIHSLLFLRITTLYVVGKHCLYRSYTVAGVSLEPAVVQRAIASVWLLRAPAHCIRSSVVKLPVTYAGGKLPVCYR